MADENILEGSTEREGLTKETVEAFNTTIESFLQKKEARNVKGPPWARGNENPTTRYLHTVDNISQTSFLIEEGPEIDEKERYTLLRWFSTNSDRPSGGWIKIVKNTDGEMRMTSGKGDLFSIRDKDSWQGGMAYRMYPSHEYDDNMRLSPGEIDRKLEQLKSSLSDLQQTNITADFAENEYSSVETIWKHEEVQPENGGDRSSESQQKYDQAKKKRDEIHRIILDQNLEITVRPENVLGEGVEISPEELQKFQERFAILKGLIETARRPKEKWQAQMASTFAIVMGLDAYREVTPKQASLLYNGLKTTGALDKFAFVPAERTITVNGKMQAFEEYVNVINVEAAREIMNKHKETLGLGDADITKLTGKELTDMVTDIIENQSDPKKRAVASGLLSGFPEIAVKEFQDEENDLNEADIKTTILDEPLDEYFQTASLSSSNTELPYNAQSAYFAGPKRFCGVTIHKDSGEAFLRIQGYGVNYAAAYPLDTSIDDYCRYLLTLDNKLEISTYFKKISEDAT